MIISCNPRNSMMLLSTLGEMLGMSDMKKEEVAEQISPEAVNKLCRNETTVGVPSNCAVGSLRLDGG
jgi:hypothetical protein